MKILFTISVLMLLFCSISLAAVYYIDDQGNDINTGLSEGSPWKSISKVNSRVFNSGDVILFKRGCRWYETLLIKQDNLTFGSYGTGSLPVIDGGMARSYNIYMNGRSGVTIREFNLLNQAGSGSIRIESSNNCIVQNCEIYVTAHGGVFIQNSRNCIVRGNSMTTPDYINAQTDGIYSQRNNNNIYENNYIVISNSADTQHNDGIQCYLDTSITARGNYCEQRNLKTGNAQGIYATNTFGRYLWYNNIINTPNIMSNSLALKNLDAALYRGTIEVYHNTVITKGGNALCIQNAPDFIARNNIFVSRGTTYAVTVIGNYNGGNLDNNIYFNYGTSGAVVRLENFGGNHTLAMLQAKGLELNGLFGNPLLDIEYMPSENSPVIDKGIVISSVLIDKNGTVRPQGPTSDMGALERISGIVTGIPLAPKNLTAQNDSTSKINLTWEDASDNETGFQLERLGVTWGMIAVLDPNSTSYSDTGLAPGTLYSYRIRAFNNAGVSDFSNIASAKTDSVILPPIVINNITIQAMTGILSGGTFLTVKAGSIANQVVQFTAKSKSEYSLNIPSEADWFIEGRFFHSKRSNSFTVQLNEGNKLTFSNNKIVGQWAAGPKVFIGHLIPGTYTITVSNVKPGDEALFDIMTLTANASADYSVQPEVDEEYVLANYPNPFNPSTKISFQIPAAGNVEISVFNSLGEKVADLMNEFKQAGYFEVNWDTSNQTSGIYFCLLRSGEFTNVRKMILMK